MKRLRRNSAMAVIMTALMVMSVFLGGCSNSLLDSNGVTRNDEPRVLGRGVAASGAQLSGSNLYVEQVVSSLTGATISLYDVTLIVPPMAVNNDTLFSISIPDPALFYNEFGTHGLQFNVPVTIVMCYRDADLSGVNETTIRLAWFDEYYQSWRDMPCTVDYAGKTVTGQLSHFSSYGLISD